MLQQIIALKALPVPSSYLIERSAYIEDSLQRPDSFAHWGDKPLFKTWGMSHATRHRDSELLSQSNWDFIVRNITAIDPDQKHWEILQCSHSLVGWMDHLIFDTHYEPIVELLFELYNDERDYPVLDEMDYSERQYNTIYDYWKDCSLDERIDLCKDTGISIFVARKDDIPEEVFDWLMDSELAY